MEKFSRQMLGFFGSKECAQRKLNELETDYEYEIRSFDKYSWYLWRLDKKND